MKCVFIVVAISTLNLLCQAEDCLINEDDSSAVQLIFEGFEGNHRRGDCLEKINDEAFAKNVKFLKISGFKNRNSDKTNKKSKEDLNIIAKHFKGVRALDISYNPNIELNWVTSYFENLLFLNASHNDISNISPIEFYSSLQEIDLSFNHIGDSDLFFFKNLLELKVIDLTNNTITVLRYDFGPNMKLETIRLGNNPIKSIDSTMLKLLEKSIDGEISLHQNKWIDATCMDDRLKVFVENEYFVMQSVISKKKLRIEKTALSESTHVQFGANQLSNMSEILELLGPTLEILGLNGNFIGKLNDNTFQRFSNLWGLSLDRTNLTEFDVNPFENLKKLYSLSISQNNFNHINVALLKDTLMQLEIFNISGNNLDNVHEIIQNLGPELHVLDVSQNFIGKLNATTFQGLKELGSLSLSQTNLTDFDCDPFADMRLLHSLDISNNNLKKLNASVLSTTLNRVYLELNLAGNGIENTAELISHICKDISRLILSGNHIGKMDNTTFATLKEPPYLDLKNTNLSNFQMNFLDSSSMIGIDISYNNLTNADFSRSSSQYDQFGFINMEFNNLTELTGLNKTAYPNLKQIFIKGNRFTCEYISNFKKTWDGLEIIGDPCNE